MCLKVSSSTIPDGHSYSCKEGHIHSSVSVNLHSFLLLTYCPLGYSHLSTKVLNVAYLFEAAVHDLKFLARELGVVGQGVE
jgi:hypothetical protein